MKRARVFVPRCPLPAREGASLVVMQMIAGLRAHGYAVEIVTWLAGGAESQFARLSRVLRSLLSALSSVERLHYPLPLARAWQKEAAGLPPAELNIFIYGFAYAWLQAFRPAGFCAVYLHNLESELFAGRTRAYAFWNPLGWLSALNAHKLRRHELSLCHPADTQKHAWLCDEIWWLSPGDAETLATLASTRGSVSNPMRHRVVGPAFREDLRALRRDLRQRCVKDSDQQPGPMIWGFVGDLDFWPNRRALDWILQKLLPLSERFEGFLLIAGRGAPDLRHHCCSNSRIKWLGFVEDLEEPFWAQIDGLLIPHLGGSGVKIKLIEAMASGIPFLTHTRSRRMLVPTLQNYPGGLFSDDLQCWQRALKGEEPKLPKRGELERQPYPSDLDARTVMAFVDSLLSQRNGEEIDSL